MRHFLGKKKKDLHVEHCEAALVTWVNEDGHKVEIPLIKEDGDWVPLDTYFIYGLSASDPGFPTGYALPFDWQPSDKITQLLKEH